MLSAPDTIQRLGGIVRGSQLQDLGFDRRSLARKVDAGEIERLRAGVFASGRVPDEIRTAVAHGGAATCVTVLRAHGIWTLPTDLGAVHVWLGPGRHGHQHPGCVCVVHYYRGARPLATASLGVALLHVRQCAGDEAFFAAYESAWRLGTLSKVSRARIRAALPQNARWLVDIARSDADSGLESLLRLRLHLLGIRLDCQVTIATVGRVDFVIGGRLILEADGRSNHDDASHRHKDLVRDSAASALGYETLRFDYAQIVHDWAEVQKAVLAAIRRSAER
nr:type IV toxin-antitoxin system AbiEi family antitoxin domain-containing protein [Microbacterium hydrocarbonoxydans]